IRSTEIGMAAALDEAAELAHRHPATIGAPHHPDITANTNDPASEGSGPSTSTSAEGSSFSSTPSNTGGVDGDRNTGKGAQSSASSPPGGSGNESNTPTSAQVGDGKGDGAHGTDPNGIAEDRNGAARKEDRSVTGDSAAENKTHETDRIGEEHTAAEPSRPEESSSQAVESDSDPGDRNGHSAVEVSTSDPVPLPDATEGQTLETVDESRVTRGDDGLIDSVDGRPVEKYIQDKAIDRANYMRELVENGLSKKSLGKEGGAVNSVVVDLQTGKISEGINGRPNDVIEQTEVHKLLQNRIEKMRNEGPYEKWNRITGEKNGVSEFPQPDNPLRHAEIKAVNKLLQERGEDISEQVFSNFLVESRFTLHKTGTNPAEACSNCTRLLDGTETNNGMNFHPPGHPQHKETKIQGRINQ
ncbi:hypothetical protein, partial [Salinactinospora qingdaonensis]|uniref:hypothetical protein n=1 Tax=Salinactinospora qingdaonensis TaxID=702744 RepID=UPI0031EE1918